MNKRYIDCFNSVYVVVDWIYYVEEDKYYVSVYSMKTGKSYVRKFALYSEAERAFHMECKEIGLDGYPTSLLVIDTLVPGSDICEPAYLL